MSITEFISKNIIQLGFIGIVCYSLSSYFQEKPTIKYKVRKNESKGEKECRNLLTNLQLSYIQEYGIKGYNYRYDFMFTLDNQRYIVEIDGEQHFKHTKYFQPTIEDYHECRRRDVEKTYIALRYGYNVIRISYDELYNLQEHINRAIRGNSRLYFSNQERYKFITTDKLFCRSVDKINLVKRKQEISYI